VTTPPAQPRRVLHALDATLITVGAMVGSGIFQTPADIARRVGSTAAALTVWALGGALSLLGVLAVAELGAAYPDSGGLYVHLRRAFGPGVAFLLGWTLLTVLLPSSVAYFSLVTAGHLAPLLHVPAPTLSVVGLVVVTAVNLTSVRAATSLHDVTTALRVLALVAVALAALFATPAHTALAPAPPVHAMSLLGAVIPVLWAYDGWMELPSLAGEMKRPGRDLPRALVAGTLAVTAIYLLVVYAFHRTLGTAALASAQAPGAALGRALAGSRGEAGLSALVATSTFGACVVGMLTAVRGIAAMGASGDFVRGLGRLGPRGTPDRATLVAAVLALAYLRTPLGRLGEIFVLGAWPFYALGGLAVIALRRKDPDTPRPFRMPWYPWPAVAFLLSTAAVIVAFVRMAPRASLLSLALIAAGIPVGWLWRGLGRART